MATQTGTRAQGSHSVPAQVTRGDIQRQARGASLCVLVAGLVIGIAVVLYANQSGAQWGSTVGLLFGALGLLSAAWILAIRPLIDSSLELSHEVQRTRRNEELWEERLSAAEVERERSHLILSATHHELFREVTLIGFALDDIEDALANDDGSTLDLRELTSAYARLDEGRDSVSAFANLGLKLRSEASDTVSAEELKVLTTESLEISAKTLHPLEGVSRGLIKALVKNAARNAESHGGANALSVITTGSQLIIKDNGKGCTQEEIDAAWSEGARVRGGRGSGMAIMKRVLEAHDATAEVEAAVGKGVKITITFPGPALDLRPPTRHAVSTLRR